jgi:hypothetical protein
MHLGNDYYLNFIKKPLQFVKCRNSDKCKFRYNLHAPSMGADCSVKAVNEYIRKRSQKCPHSLKHYKSTKCNEKCENEMGIKGSTCKKC